MKMMSNIKKHFLNINSTYKFHKKGKAATDVSSRLYFTMKTNLNI